jgi:hypothetical protein
LRRWLRIFPAKAKRVIFSTWPARPSHLELFDYKPELAKFDGQTCPEKYLEGKRFAFIQGHPEAARAAVCVQATR